MRNDTGIQLIKDTWQQSTGVRMMRAAGRPKPEADAFNAAVPAATPDLAYYYDGTWEGWLCCVYESYTAKEIPGMIAVETEQGIFVETSLFYAKRIVTRTDLAERVRKGITDKIGEPFLHILERIFCSCISRKEEQMLLFVYKGFRYGMQILNLRQDTVVKNVLKGLRDLGREIDKWYGFVRFSDVRGILVAVIGAKNNVLPFIASHFCDRFHNEHFMIFDQNHKMALVYKPGKCCVIPMEDFVISEISDEERKYRILWKNYYDAIEIRPRHNEVCRRTHMPKRYWDFLTEMTEKGDCIPNYKGIE